MPVPTDTELPLGDVGNFSDTHAGMDCCHPSRRQALRWGSLVAATPLRTAHGASTKGLPSVKSRVWTKAMLSAARTRSRVIRK
ncbi:hypothetical protein Sm713_68410 [Streptomyces sp. TS71-3]|nr:hypothetical protein Sm713_68410 [Streptomyces sp. TS71-3]